MQQSGVKDADSPRHVTIQTKTTLFQSILTKDEFIHIIGIRLAIALESNRGGLPTYFSAEYSEGMDTVLTGGDFDRKFGTSMSRFQSVMQH